MLVGADGTVSSRTTTAPSGGDQTRHPEFEIARWAANNMAPEDRPAATVYTSGEHCAMCSAAHGWVGLGRIVIAASSEQLRGWAADLGASPRASPRCRSTRSSPTSSSRARTGALAAGARLQRRFFAKR